MNERTITPLNDGDNPPAFPACNEANLNDTMGMTLRDHFAGQLMPSLIRTAPSGMSFGTAHEANNLTYANVAYSLADAMLRARKENGQ